MESLFKYSSARLRYQNFHPALHINPFSAAKRLKHSAARGVANIYVTFHTHHLPARSERPSNLPNPLLALNEMRINNSEWFYDRFFTATVTVTDLQVIFHNYNGYGVRNICDNKRLLITFFRFDFDGSFPIVSSTIVSLELNHAADPLTFNWIRGVSRRKNCFICVVPGKTSNFWFKSFFYDYRSITALVFHALSHKTHWQSR